MNATDLQRYRVAKINLKASIKEDAKFAAGKIAFVQYLSVAVFLFLFVSFWELQVRDSEDYRDQAERNSIKSIPVLAPRGRLLDRDGRVIVDNHASYTLILARENLNLEHVRPIAEGLGLDYEELRARIDRFRSRPRYEPVIVKNELTRAEIEFVEAHRDPGTFPEMELIPSHRRLYPHEGFAAHAIGYVGEISDSELELPQFIERESGDVVGKAGIEREYNDILMGVNGRRQVVVDNRGHERDLLGYKKAVGGKDLQLTLDLDVQVVAELAMQGRKGAIVALDPRNGEILAMASSPAYDPNQFTGRIRAGDWKQIVDDPGNPMLNRPIQAQFAPGSTFKPIMALAGLERGVINEDYRVHCPGGATYYGHYFKCHLKGGHGTVDLQRGLAQSCDVFFYNVGNRLGIDTIAEYAGIAGLGNKTGIDLPGEAAGTVPSSAWKMKTFRQKWYAGETISVAIGQGALTVTPLQIVSALAGISQGGVWHRPHFVKGTPDQPRVRKIDPAVTRQIVDGMYGVVNEGGTGVRAHLPGVSVCGKTGTAQRISNAAKGKGGADLRDNAWFVAFAPCEAPEVALSVLWEGGGESKYSAAIARDVLKAYFDKKARAARDHLTSGQDRLMPAFQPVPLKNSQAGD